MAFASDNRTHTISISDRVAHMVAQVQSHRAKRKLYRETFGELNALTNAELTDIGMSRSMLRRVALEAAGLV